MPLATLGRIPTARAACAGELRDALQGGRHWPLRLPGHRVALRQRLLLGPLQRFDLAGVKVLGANWIEDPHAVGECGIGKKEPAVRKGSRLKIWPESAVWSSDLDKR